MQESHETDSDDLQDGSISTILIGSVVQKSQCENHEPSYKLVRKYLIQHYAISIKI